MHELQALAAEGDLIGALVTGSSLTRVALTPDGRVMVTRDTAGVSSWDLASGEQRWVASAPGPGPVAVSDDGTRVAGDALLDGATGAHIAPLDAPTELAFSHDGTRLASAGNDRPLHIHDVDRGALMATLGPKDRISAMAWAPADELLVAGTDSGSVRVWPAALETLRRRRLAAYSADDTKAAEDLTSHLAIDADVDAFAALIAARAVQPPLSIGLFGRWGSGKTFFMRRLKARIAELATEARSSGQLQRDVAWHKRIVQIEFNAWHYAEGNLWASLVEHILTNLRVDGEPKNRVIRRQQEIVAWLTTQQELAGSAKADAANARATLDEKRQALADLQTKDPLRAAATGEVRNAVASAIWSTNVGESLHDLQKALGAASEELKYGAGIVEPLVRADHRVLRLVALFAALAVGPLAAWLVAHFTHAIDHTFAGLAASLAATATWVRSQVAWTRKQLDKVRVAADKLEAPIRAQRREYEAALLAAQSEFRAAAHRAEEVERRVTALESELAETTASRLLARLIADRAASDDYRQHLGLLALIRRDFEAMAEFLQLQETTIDGFATLADEDREQIEVGRIVLYIDDLDRCEPAQVVAVLQALHLLLAFPLFTVVLGVDVSWVEHSLRTHHAALFDAGTDRVIIWRRSSRSRSGSSRWTPTRRRRCCGHCSARRSLPEAGSRSRRRARRRASAGSAFRRARRRRPPRRCRHQSGRGRRRAIFARRAWSSPSGRSWPWKSSCR